MLLSEEKKYLPRIPIQLHAGRTLADVLFFGISKNI